MSQTGSHARTVVLVATAFAGGALAAHPSHGSGHSTSAAALG